MASKADFSPDEWSQILQSVMLAGLTVTAADPSGPIGLIKEGFASSKELLAVKNDPAANGLVRAVVADFETAEGRTQARDAMKGNMSAGDPAAFRARMLDLLKSTGALLDAKAPDDAPAFKAWLQQIADRVAGASSEGGFLGFGGVQVSDAERQALADIATALGKA